MGSIGHAAEQSWLSSLHERLVDDLRQQTARLERLTAETGDAAEEHNRVAHIATTRHVIGQITAALGRITDGRYGQCEGCAREIPRERLEILPHAQYCVPCKARQ